MTDEQRKKDTFVRCELRDFIRAIDPNIINTAYFVAGGEEYVQVDWLFTGQKYHKKIRVTADSLKAIALDVIKHI